MKLWTYGEVREKLERDLDLEDETFITRNEMAGFCNEAVDAAEAEIMKLAEDYFLTEGSLTMVQGASYIDLPTDIYGQKIRDLIYNDGSTVYPVKRLRGSLKFRLEADINTFAPTDFYNYFLINKHAGNQAQIKLIPAARESSTSRLTLNYIRNAKRVPLTGEFIDLVDSDNELLTFLGTAITGGATDSITLPAHGLVSGDVIFFNLVAGSTLIGTIGQEFWVTKIDADTFKISDSLINQKIGTFVNLTAGLASDEYSIEVEVTNDIQDATVLDIPEFTTFLMQFMKVRCYEKEPDPRYDAAVKALVAHQAQMVDTLTERTPDNETKIEMDQSFYMEHS